MKMQMVADKSETEDVPSDDVSRNASCISRNR